MGNPFSGLGNLWEDTWDNLEDWGSDFDDFVFGGGFEDDLKEAGRWFDDEVWEPVYEFQKDVVNGILDDPLEFIWNAIMVATGQAWLLPLVNAAAVIDAGGDWKDALKAAAVGYTAQYLGPKVGGITGDIINTYVPEEYMNDIVYTSLVEGTEAGTSALILGESFSDAFVDGVLRVSTDALAGYAMGEIDKQIGLTFEDAEGNTKAIPQSIINVISAGFTAEIKGEEITDALLAEAVSKALVTTELVSSVIGSIPGVSEGILSDRQLSFLTTSIQRTATVALAGGTGGDAARILKETFKGYANAELTAAVKESALGDVLDNGLDVLTGDFSKVQGTIDAMSNLWTNSIEALQTQADNITGNIEEYGTLFNIAVEKYNQPRFMTGSGSNSTEYSFAEIGANANVSGWTWKRGTSTYRQSNNYFDRNEMVFNPNGGGQTFADAFYDSEVQKLKDGGNSYYHGSDGHDRASRDAGEYLMAQSFRFEIVGEDRSWWKPYGNQMTNGKQGSTRESMDISQWEREQYFYFNNSISALGGDVADSWSVYDDYVTDNTDLLNNLATDLDPLYAEWDNYVTTLNQEMEDFETSSDNVGDLLSNVDEQISIAFVNAMDPNFDAVEYAEINELEDDVNTYSHWLAVGSKQGLATNDEMVETKQRNDIFDSSGQILQEIVTYADKPSNNNTLMFSQTYLDLIKGTGSSPVTTEATINKYLHAGSMEEYEALLAAGNEAAITQFLIDTYANAKTEAWVAETMIKQMGYGNIPAGTSVEYEADLRERYYDIYYNSFAGTWERGYAGNMAGADREFRNNYSDVSVQNANPGVEFWRLDSAVNEDFSNAPTTLSGDTTWSDVIAGTATKRFNVTTNKFEWAKTTAEEAAVTIWDTSKGLIPFTAGTTDFVTLRTEDPIDFLNNLIEMNEVVVTAERASIIDGLERNGMAGFIDMAVWMGTKREELKQDVLDAIPGSQARKDRFEDDAANLVEWGAGMVNIVNGMQRFIGMDVNPEVTAWAEKWQGLGAEMHTQGYKDARAENDAIMAAPIPAGMGNAEGTARKILGTLENRPSVFLMDMVGGEVFQEGLPWLVGAGAVALTGAAVGAAGLPAAAGAASTSPRLAGEAGIATLSPPCGERAG